MSKEFIPVSHFKPLKTNHFGPINVEHQVYININRIAFFSHVKINGNECYVIKLNHRDTQDLIPTDYTICKKDNPDAFYTLSNKY